MNDELFKNFTISCNHAIGTTQSYELSLRKYCIYFDMSLKELLEEAEEDEMNGVKWKHSRLKSKLVEYRHYMFQNYASGTVRKEMNCIIFFYKFYDIEVLDLPKVNDKNIQKPAPIYFKDLPDKEVIREAFQMIVNVDKDKLQAFLSSFEDAEEVGTNEYTVDFYDTEPPLSMNIEFTKDGADVLAALYLEFDEEQDGWYLGEKTKDVELITSVLSHAMN